MGDLVREMRALSWTRVLVAATAIAFLTIVFIYQMVYAYVASYSIFSRGELEAEHAASIAAFVSGWGARAFFFMLVILAASWVARRAGGMPIMHGAVVGVFAAILVQAVFHFVYPPVLLGEASIYLALGAVSGWLGGMVGRNTLAGHEALYRASRQIGEARDPRAVAAAIGEHLTGPDVVGVAIWRIAREAVAEDAREIGSADAFELWASWAPRTEEDWISGMRFDARTVPALARLAENRSAWLRGEELPESAGRTRQRFRSALTVPLVAPDGGPVGLLMVMFRKKRRLPVVAAREYLTVSTQAALALENIRLVEEAQKTGRHIGVLEERHRLSHEIHDTLAQDFTGIDMNLSAALMAQDTGGSPEDPLRQHVELARSTARKGAKEARRLVWALRPELLDRHPLSEGLANLIDEWSEQAGVEVTATTNELRPLTPQVENTLLRAAQEALSNVRKHAHADRVDLSLAYAGDRVVLDIRDDGVGFDPDEMTVFRGRRTGETGGFGLASMRERVEQLGGSLVVRAAPDKGTRLVVELPAAGIGDDVPGHEPTAPALRTWNARLVEEAP